MHDAWKNKLENPEDWVERTELRKFLKMEGSKTCFNNWINEIEALENSYLLYIQGTLESNETFNKVRFYNYINDKRLNKKRNKHLKKGA